MVNGSCYTMISFTAHAPPYWKKGQRVDIPDGCFSSSLDMWSEMIRAVGPQHPTVAFPGTPFTFGKKHIRIVVSHGTIVQFNDGIGKAKGHAGPHDVSQWKNNTRHRKTSRHNDSHSPRLCVNRR